jgi:hypothetical protein
MSIIKQKRGNVPGLPRHGNISGLLYSTSDHSVRTYSKTVKVSYLFVVLIIYAPVHLFCNSRNTFKIHFLVCPFSFTLWPDSVKGWSFCSSHWPSVPHESHLALICSTNTSPPSLGSFSKHSWQQGLLFECRQNVLGCQSRKMSITWSISYEYNSPAAVVDFYAERRVGRQFITIHREIWGFNSVDDTYIFSGVSLMTNFRLLRYTARYLSLQVSSLAWAGRGNTIIVNKLFQWLRSCPLEVTIYCWHYLHNYTSHYSQRKQTTVDLNFTITASVFSEALEQSLGFRIF